MVEIRPPLGRAPADTPALTDEAQVGGTTPGRTPTLEEIELVRRAEEEEAILWPEEKDDLGPAPLYMIRLYVFDTGDAGVEVGCFETGDWRLRWFDNADAAINSIKELIQLCKEEEEPPAESEVYGYEPEDYHDPLEIYEREDVYPPARGEDPRE